MTIEGPPWPTVDGTVTLTRLPRPGWVLVSSPTTPAVPRGRCVDVRPGAAATFDGDRVWMPLLVTGAGERHRLDRSELPALEDVVLGLLETGRVDTVRFGDRAAYRRALSAAAVRAIERRLLSAARRTRATLLTWTGHVPRNEDYRRYDVVVQGPAIRFDEPA